MNDELIHLLGYLTERQWKDSLNKRGLDNAEIKKLFKEMSGCYNMGYDLE